MEAGQQQPSTQTPGAAFALAAAVAVGAALGLAPLAVFFAKPLWWVAAIIVSFGVALVVYVPRMNRAPLAFPFTLAEWALGCLTAAFSFAVASWVTLSLMGMLWIFETVLQALFRWTGGGWLSWLISILPKLQIFVAIPVLMAMIAEGISELWRSFDPAFPAIETPHRERLRSGGKEIVTTGAIGVAVFVAVSVGWGWVFAYNWSYAAALNFVVIMATHSFYLGTSEWPGFFARQRKLLAERAPKAVAESLRAAGFSLVNLPAAADESVAPLLADLDVLARHEGRVYAIEIRTPTDGDEPIEWTAGAGLQSAALACEFLIDGAGPIEPVMLLFGVKAGTSIGTFAAEQTLRFIEIEPARVRAVLDPEDREARAALAREIRQPEVPAPVGGKP